jgi:hypothetical protein
LTLIVGLALVALVACSNDEDDGSADSTSTPPAATAAATQQTPGSGEETPATGVNIPEVDDIVVAILSGDPEKVRPLVRFETLACVVTDAPSTQPPVVRMKSTARK